MSIYFTLTCVDRMFDRLLRLLKVRLQWPHRRTCQSIWESSAVFISVFDATKNKYENALSDRLFLLDKQYSHVFIAAVCVVVAVSTVSVCAWWKSKLTTCIPKSFFTVMHFELLSYVMTIDVEPQVRFSSQGNIFHSNGLHWLTCCLLADHL